VCGKDTVEPYIYILTETDGSRSHGGLDRRHDILQRACRLGLAEETEKM
jgi:hypothetical protein